MRAGTLGRRLSPALHTRSRRLGGCATKRAWPAGEGPRRPSSSPRRVGTCGYHWARFLVYPVEPASSPNQLPCSWRRAHKRVRRPSLVNRRCGGAPCCRTAPAGRLGLRRIQVPLATGPNGKRPGCLRSAGYIRRPTALGCPGRGRRRPGLQITREWVRLPLRRGVPAFLKSHFKSQVIKSSLRY